MVFICDRIILIFLLLLGLTCNEGKWGLVKDQGIPLLSVKQSEEFFAENPVVFVKFVATYCPRCDKIKHEYKKLVQQMEQEDDIPIIKINCEEEKDFCLRHQIHKYPAIKLFKNKFHVDYRGKKTAEEMYSWISQRKDTFIDRIDTVEEVNVFNKERIAVLYILPEGDEAAINIFMNAAHQYLDVKFAYSYSQEVVDHFALKSNYSLVFFRQFDEPIRYYVSSQMISLKRILAFINHLKYPKVLEFNKEVFDKLYSERKGSFLFFYDERSGKEMEDFKKLAVEKHGRALYFTLVDVRTEEGEKMMRMMGIKDTNFPVIRIFKSDPNGHLKYKVPDITYEGLKKTFDEYVNDKLSRYFISDTVPSSNKGLVKQVVGSNFKEMVLDSHKFALVLAYSPECMPCINLMSTFNRLAENLQGYNNLAFFKMDASRNEYVTFSITDYPTVAFFLPRTNSSVVYKGGNNYVELAEFMGNIMKIDLLERKDAEDL